MNLVVLFSSILLFTLFGKYTCAVLPNPPSSLEKVDDSISDVGQEQVGSSSLISESKLNENLDDHAGDHDQNTKVVPRKGVTLPEDEVGKVPPDVHLNRNISTDRASTTITKDSESLANQTSKTSSNSKDNVTNSNTSQSSASDKYSPSESKSTKTDASHTSSSMISDKSDNSSSTSDTSKSKTSASKSVSTESTSSKSSFNKKPLVTYSVEDDPTLLNVPRVRQIITPLTPLDVKAEGDSAYLQPSSDFVLDRTQVKREMYIFPLVVLIFLVPMVLGVGIIILRRVRDYWSTRHYRRMDFLVDGMYNT